MPCAWILLWRLVRVVSLSQSSRVVRVVSPSWIIYNTCNGYAMTHQECPEPGEWVETALKVNALNKFIQVKSRRIYCRALGNISLTLISLGKIIYIWHTQWHAMTHRECPAPAGCSGGWSCRRSASSWRRPDRRWAAAGWLQPPGGARQPCTRPLHWNCIF